jgi:hypothetical protein
VNTKQKGATMLLSRREYAAHRGVTVAAVQKAVETGRISLKDGKIDPEKADKEWAENTNPAYNTPHTSDSSSNPYQKSKIMKTTYDAMLKKLEYEERAGKLIPRAQVESDAFAAARTARDHLLMIPKRVAPRIIGQNSISEIEYILAKEITDSLTSLCNLLKGNNKGE